MIGRTEATLKTNFSATQRDHLRTVLDAGEFLLNALDSWISRGSNRQVWSSSTSSSTCTSTVRGTFDSLAIRVQDKGLSLSCSIDPLVPVTLIGDPARLRQGSRNLLHNAVEFMARGEVAAEVELKAADGYGDTVVYFSVRDTGPGIAAEQLDGIFEPFEQAHPPSLRATARDSGSRSVSSSSS